MRREPPRHSLAVACALLLGSLGQGATARAAGAPVADGKAPPERRHLDQRPSGSSTLTYYLDSRDYGTLNVLTSAPDLPLGLNVWGFVDLHADQDGGSRRFDTTRYFTEYRLRRAVGLSGLGVELEYNGANGPDNDMLRAGITYKRSVPLLSGNRGWVQVRAHVYETDGSGQQVSVLYSLPVSARVSISGFADLNVNADGANRWVVEPQLNVRVARVLDLVLELRYNGYEDANPTIDGVGIAIGGKIRL